MPAQEFNKIKFYTFYFAFLRYVPVTTWAHITLKVNKLRTRNKNIRRNFGKIIDYVISTTAVTLVKKTAVTLTKTNRRCLDRKD